MSESPNVGGAGLDSAAVDDAAAFNKGKGRTLAGMIAAALVAIGAVAWLLAQDGGQAEAELGKQVNGLKSQLFDGFLVCALPGSRVNEIKNNEDLSAGFHERGRAGARYGAHLRGKCSPMLRELGTQLRALPPNQEFAAQTESMAKAATSMSVGVESFATYLEGLEGAYEQAAAEPELTAVARGWFEFRKAYGDFNRMLKEKLGR